MSILSAIKQESNSLDDLAKLPQTLIMQMAQNGQISKEMVAPILGKKAEMADAVARMNAMQQGGQQQSVMEQIMQKNAQGENPIPQIPTKMQETGVAQIPTREPQYAGGGIVAFDGGGMAMSMDDDDEDSYAEAVADAEHKGMLSKLYGMLGKMPKSFVSSKADAEMKSAGIGSLPSSQKSGHPYEEDAIKAAKQVGLDPSIMLHALYKETGGLKDPATAKSKAGAYGPMQLMAATAKELGVDRKDPYENILGGATYLKQQLDTFKDPKLALAAYNAGPGAVRRALSGSQGIAALPRETQGYMKYAEGGMVPGYAIGQYIDPADTLSPGEELMGLPPKKRDLFEEWMNRNAISREESKKGAAEDRSLALLQAGLGMMAGTSPYAMANIGAGALQGTQAYSASKRARTQEQMMMDKMEIGALGAKTKQESLDEYREARRRQADAELDIKREAQLNKPSAADIARNKVLSAINQDDTIAGLLKERTAKNFEPGTPEYQFYEDKIADIKKKYFEDAGLKPPTAGLPQRNFPISKINPGGYNQVMPTWLGGMSKEDLQAIEWANSNPTDPRAMAIKQRLGK